MSNDNAHKISALELDLHNSDITLKVNWIALSEAGHQKISTWQEQTQADSAFGGKRRIFSLKDDDPFVHHCPILLF